MTITYYCYQVPDDEAHKADLDPTYTPREAYVGTLEVPCDETRCQLRSDDWIAKAGIKAYGRGTYASAVLLDPAQLA
jgi:hypothetical protein